jgi:DNA-binding ferritin-like protein (Dps family)
MNMSIARMIDQKRRYRRYKNRKKQLPANYRKALDAVERFIQNYQQNLWINRERERLIHTFESITREEKTTGASG